MLSWDPKFRWGKPEFWFSHCTLRLLTMVTQHHCRLRGTSKDFSSLPGCWDLKFTPLNTPTTTHHATTMPDAKLRLWTAPIRNPLTSMGSGRTWECLWVSCWGRKRDRAKPHQTVQSMPPQLVAPSQPAEDPTANKWPWIFCHPKNTLSSWIVFRIGWGDLPWVTRMTTSREGQLQVYEGDLCHM